MKSFLVLTIFLLIGAAIGQKFIPGKRVFRGGRITKTSAELCTDASKKGNTYCNGNEAAKQCDATGFVYCTGTRKGIEFDCGGDLPFCNDDLVGKAKCVTQKPDGCELPASRYECMAEGMFPDATDCKKFYQCTENADEDYLVDEFECDNLYVFDPSAPNGDYCRFTRNRFCITVNCGNSLKNVLMPYPFFPRNRGELIATCRGSRKPLVTRCSAGFQADLKTLPVECKIVCRGAVKYEYPGDDSKYYDCVRTLRGWEGKVKSCYRGYYFNKVTKKCAISLTTTTKTTSTTTTTPPPTTITENLETSTIEEETSTIESETSIIEEETSTIEGETSTIEEETSTIEGEAST